MEVTILQADNVPERPVLDIRMGPSRKQGPLEVNQAVSLPDPGSHRLPVEVGLFERLVSQTIPAQEHGAREVQIPVMPAGGPATQVKLRIRSSPMAERFADEAASVASGPRRSPLGSSSPGSLNNSLGGSSGPHRDDEDMDRLLDWFQGMMGDVLREQPTDPLAFMLQKLRTRKQETASQLAELGAACARSAASAASSHSQGSTAAPSAGSSCDSEAVHAAEPPPPEAPKQPRLPDRPCPGRSGRNLARQVTRQKAAAAASDGGSQPPSPTARRPPPAQAAPPEPLASADTQQPAGAGEAPERRPERTCSKIAARFSISMILQGSACQAAMHESLREKARKEAAVDITRAAFASVTATLLGEVKQGNAISRCPSRAGRKSTLGRASLQLTDAAARASGEHRPSLPTPIVSLGGDRTSWGQWLT